MTASLYVAHQTAGRTRLRLAGQKINTADLAAIAELIATLPGVAAAEPRAPTGSIVIQHPGLATGQLNASLQQLPFNWGPQPESDARPALMPLTGSMDSADEWLHDTTGGRVDMHTAIIIVMLSLALSQAIRGNIMAPATSLVWYALDLLLRKDGRSSL